MSRAKLAPDDIRKMCLELLRPAIAASAECFALRLEAILEAAAQSTDEKTEGAGLRERMAALEAELTRMRPVVEAAVELLAASRDVLSRGIEALRVAADAEQALFAAVAVYQAAKKGGQDG